MAHVDNPDLPQLAGGPGGALSESRANHPARAEKAALQVLESTGIRDGRDLEILADIMEHSTVERNKLRAAEVLAANRLKAADILTAKGGTVNVDARSVTLQIGQGKPTHTDLAAALRLLAASGAGENTSVGTVARPVESDPHKNGKSVPGG